MIDFENIDGFEWDKGNLDKNFSKHGVINKECEEIFKNKPLLISFDSEHSIINEERYNVLGKTFKGRKIFLSITIRNNKIRIISARDMSKNERKKYNEEETKQT